MTLDELRDHGCNVDEGLKRCMNNEAFYLKMVDMFFSDGSKIEALGTALNANALDDAFEQAHALKGVCANLALTPLESKISEITELLRAHTQMDYSDMYKEISGLFDKMKTNE